MQNINLLTSLPKSPKKYLTAEWLILSALGWIVLLFIIYGLSATSVYFKQKKLNALNSNVQKITEQINIVNKAIASFEQKDTTITAQEPTASTTQNIEQLQKLLGNKTTKGFAPYLVSLSAAIPPGVWLTNITISSADKFITLKGNALSSTLIPEFIKELTKSTAFSQDNFTTLQLTTVQAKTEPTFVSFTLTSTMSEE